MLRPLSRRARAALRPSGRRATIAGVPAPEKKAVVRAADKKRIFELLRIYHQSRENIRLLLEMSPMADYEKIGFIDAWQEEMAEFFARNGYCFACNRLLGRCECAEPIRPRLPHPAA